MFNRKEFIKSINNTLNRVSQMKDKVKARIILDKFIDMSEENYYLYFFADEELWEIYSDILYKYRLISENMNENEIKQYGTHLTNIILNPDWCKKEQEIFLNRIKESHNYFYKIINYEIIYNTRLENGIYS
jgi:hypothetical protein